MYREGKQNWFYIYTTHSLIQTAAADKVGRGMGWDPESRGEYFVIHV